MLMIVCCLGYYWSYVWALRLNQWIVHGSQRWWTTTNKGISGVKKNFAEEEMFVELSAWWRHSSWLWISNYYFFSADEKFVEVSWNWSTALQRYFFFIKGLLFCLGLKFHYKVNYMFFKKNSRLYLLSTLIFN